MFKKKDKKINMNLKPDTVSAIPEHDWKVLLSVTSVLLLTALVFGTYIFWKTENESLFYFEQELGESKIETIDMGYLNFSLERFESRAEASLEILKQKPLVLDPSK